MHGLISVQNQSAVFAGSLQYRQLLAQIKAECAASRVGTGIGAADGQLQFPCSATGSFASYIAPHVNKIHYRS